MQQELPSSRDEGFTQLYRQTSLSTATPSILPHSRAEGGARRIDEEELSPTSFELTLTSLLFLFSFSSPASRRYLRAQKWDLAEAQRKLVDTLVWRREHGLADDDGGERSKDQGGGLNAEKIREEGKSGKE